MTDKERQDAINKAADHLKEAHVILHDFQEMIPGQFAICGTIAQAFRRLVQHRGNELMASPETGKQRREARIFGAKKPTLKGGITTGLDKVLNNPDPTPKPTLKATAKKRTPRKPATKTIPKK